MSRIADQSQFRVCVPASDFIAGRLGDGLKDILALRNGEHGQHVTRPVFSFLFLDYWQVTLIWSPYGDASLIRSLLIGDTSTTYYTDVAIRVTMTLY